ncbi:MAG TPA: BON domain-containing protein [Gammaproteobacteria bacterium]
MKTKALLTTTTAVFLAVFAALAGANESFEGASRDAWITGKIEAVYTLNRHLNPFAINTDVENGVVLLTGSVKSDIDRDLAEEIAKGIEGVTEVNNELTVDLGNAGSAREAEGSSSQDRDFGTWVNDITITAAVKSRLIANENIEGLRIDVSTDRNVVTLNGSVSSAEQSDLAEEIASNANDVAEVKNNLVVDPNA